MHINDVAVGHPTVISAAKEVPVKTGVITFAALDIISPSSLKKINTANCCCSGSRNGGLRLMTYDHASVEVFI